MVALKKIFNAFQNKTDAQRTYREIMLLKSIKHENIIRLLNFYKADNNLDIYIVFELMETDLNAVIRANILEDIHKRYIIYQLVKTLKYLHSGNLIHRDIKPSNLLLNSECHMTLCDFGLARTIDSTKNKVITDYVATRWYRAPEILMGCVTYGAAVDIWSVGCIIGELLQGKPLFRGASTMNQLQRIVTIIDKPTDEQIDKMPSNFARKMLDSIQNGSLKTFKQMFPKADPDAIDLMEKCLKFLPEERITAEEILKHPWLEAFSSTGKEPELGHIIRLHFSDDEKHSIDTYRQKLYQEMKRSRKSRSSASRRRRVTSSSQSGGR